MKNNMSIAIERPIAEVFDYASNNIVEWSPTIVEDEVLEEKPGKVGSTLRTVVLERGQRMEFQGIVTRHEPPKAFACRLTGKNFDLDVEYRFDDLGDSTRATHESSIHPKGFFKVIFFCFGWAFKKSGCKALAEELASLKEKCESRQAAD